MSLVEYKGSLSQEVRPRTVTFLVREDEVCLGYKKRGFGRGNYVGVGGKVEEGKDKSKKEGACREAQEEFGILLTPDDLQEMGVVSFYFPHIPDESWNQELTIYMARHWQGVPQESEEIKPEWFKKDHIPFDTMWDDAHYWLPQVLAGQVIKGDFLFNEDLKVVENFIK